MKEKKLNAYHIGSLLFFLSRFSFSVFGYQFLFKQAGSDTVFTFLIASGLCIVAMYFFLHLRKKTNFVFQPTSKFSKVFLFSLMALLFLFVLSHLTPLIQSAFIDLPFFLLLGIFLFLGYLFTKQGIRSLSALAIFLFGVFLFFFLFNLIGGISLMNIDFLKPVFLHSSKVLLKSIASNFLFLSPPFFFLLFLPRNALEKKEKQEKIFFSYFILGCLSVFLELLLMYLTIGSELITFYPYPLFALTSRISSFLILNRIFFLFAFYLLFDSTLFLAVLFGAMKQIVCTFKNEA